MNRPMQLFRLILALSAVLPGFALAETSRVWDYNALLDGKPIGTHRFAVLGDGPELRLESDASFSVKILFVEVYRYRHKAREVWRDDSTALSKLTPKPTKTATISTSMALYVTDSSR